MDWLHPNGRTTRRAYAVSGLSLMALKFALDRIVVLSLGVEYWSWLSYWEPVAARLTGHAAEIPSHAIPLLWLALPFIAVGVLLTLRRLRDAGAPWWLVVLFFVPALNLVLFALLSLLPSRDQPRPVAAGKPGCRSWLVRVLALQSRALSAFVAIILTAILVVPATWLATVVFKDYGWGVFVALPFVLGLVATVIHAAPQPRSFAACAGVALLALLLCGLMILAVALEGVVCLAMAAPLAAPITLLGATVGYFLQFSWWDRSGQAARVYSMSWLALPLVFATESRDQRQAPVIAATTSIEIAANPAAVWRQVVTFSELPPAREFVFRTGIAYPLRATIAGHGVGAVRRCEFSTGAFVEPITIWDEGRQLAFDVIEQPHPMHELSPYRALHPAHLDGFFRSVRGEFLLTALPNGHTRLDGTTWYTQRFWPVRYWRGWSDYLLHSIHRRVLAHIQTQAESTVPPPATN
ncbi:MAG: hypothetical protein RLZZ15_2824 [Verrucomicrobiota bacterium]